MVYSILLAAHVLHDDLASQAPVSFVLPVPIVKAAGETGSVGGNIWMNHVRENFQLEREGESGSNISLKRVARSVGVSKGARTETRICSAASSRRSLPWNQA